jgi:DNA-binding MarR family transcriptional regulator
VPVPPDAERIFREYLTATVLHGQAVAAAMGLHPTDAYALNLLGVLGPITTGELAERTGLSTGAATRLVDRLEAMGAVRRVRDPQDRRRVIVETQPLNAELRARADQVIQPARAAQAAVLATYDDAQLATLFDYFSRSTEALRAATRTQDPG